MPVSGQHQWLISWESPRTSVTGYFETFSGYEEQVVANDHYNGGEIKPEVWVERPTRSDVTFGRAYRPGVDIDFIKDISAAIGSAEEGVLTVQHVDRDMVVDEQPMVITGHIIGYKTPTADVNQAGDLSMFEVRIRPTAMA